MASSSLLSGPKRPFLKSSFLNPFRVHQNPNTNPRFPPKFSISACSSFSWEREEQLWLREEQRWLREESRWRSERESLLGQIASLRHRIEATERQRPPEDASVTPPLLAEETESKEMILEVDMVRVSEDVVEKKTMLRIGSVGEEVRAMQSGTNGAPGPPLTKIIEIQQTVVKETGDEEVELSDCKVFLLGENRWEEPSRLRNRNKPAGRSKAVSATKCLTCRGERLLNCTECDGSGEPNIEPQFLEWLGENSKCPYCEGLGYSICDDCQGKKATGQT